MSRRTRRARKRWSAGGIAVVLGAGTITYATASVPGPAQEHGREPAVRTVRLVDQGAGRRSLPRQGTERFSAALLTWDDPRAELKGTAEVRARSARTGRWSHWQTLPDSRFEGPGAASRGGTGSVWTGAADGVEVRVVRGDGTAAPGQPAGLSVALLDPGTDRGGRPAAARGASAEGGDGTPGHGGAARAAVVRDTGADGDNALSCADSRARARTLRQERLARGASGPGHDFVVDRCGQVFEDRGGPADDTAWGDVNGDGYADLVVGAPGKDDTEGNSGRGSVTVLYGPALNTGFPCTTSGVAAAGAGLGSAVAAGDFDGDGRADVFSAGTGGGGTWNVRLTGGATTSGRLTTATGPAAGLDATTGDFNGDGYADVALNHRDGYGTGRVTWFTGSAAGLTGAGPESVEGGRSVAAGDIDGDGYDDLVIGRPRPFEPGGAPGGHITVLPGSAKGLTTTGAKAIHQDAVGVAGADRPGDAFGFSVSVGDVDADGYADVLVGAPGEDFTRDGADRADAGQATLLRGTPSGLTVTGSFTLCQDTPGIPDATEKGDRFGSSVSLTDLSGHGRAGLVIGAEGEDAGDGLLLYTPVHGTGFGLARTVALRGTVLGTPAGARLGRALAP